MSGTALHGTHLRIPAERLDDLADGIGELSVLFGGLSAANGANAAGSGPADRMAVVLGQLQRDVLELRMVPVREAFDRLPRVVRDAARRLGKEVDLVVSGEDVELDRSILEEIVEPLVHLLRNAVDHGIEAPSERVDGGKSPRGRIDVQAERERASVLITVSDDGGGMDAARVIEQARKSGILAEDAEIDFTSEEVFRLVSQAGFSTAAGVTDVSGRGVGMDVVVNRVRALGGAIDMQTVHGAGTTFSMRLPVTLALVQALRVRVGARTSQSPSPTSRRSWTSPTSRGTAGAVRSFACEAAMWRWFACAACSASPGAAGSIPPSSPRPAAAARRWPSMSSWAGSRSW
jgi:two-component system, chemotaxis family, sensor kinase CheA